ncbi:MAG: hypothetical protein H6Q58_200 [Firmicutes bacterium]|nr:hypothetical protein [Bacillota bacterium]
MEFYDKYGKIKKISIKFEPLDKPEVKQQAKPETKPEVKPVVMAVKPEVEPVIEPVIEAAAEPEAEALAEAAVEPVTEPLVEAAAEPEVASVVEAIEVTSKHWTIPVPVAEPVVQPAPERLFEPAIMAAVEQTAEPIINVTSKHWTVPVSIVEMEQEPEAEPQIPIVKKEEEDVMAINRFDKTPRKEVNYCEDICNDEEQKKVCFYYRNKEYLTDDFINKCDEALDFEMNQRKEQEERAERERLLRELFGNQEE